ncbi:MAG TPA: LacI family transcriptional regulator [Gemmatimonadetes bacterium]|jgi:LacI family transcriptional regulator|nr:LacI family transcriptional regulator [Gemmatimonadota bacterium]
MVTIKDVAREAKMSVATVSRVLNGSGPVSEETRRLIREVAGRMRYVPHSGARSLITSKTQTLGVLLPDLYGEFFSEVIRGMDDTAQRNGFHLLISRAYADRHGIETAIRAMRGRADGVVVMSPDLDAESLLNLPSTIPVVLLCSVSRGNEIDSLTIQNCRGAREMVAHLISVGHKRIAIIKGSPRNYDAAERLRGYRMSLREAGITLDPLLEREGDFTEAGGYSAALKLIALRNRPTAIFAANDSMAIGVLSALRESGIAVPEEMAVAGFDDIPLARYMDPPLSSVRVPIWELGARAVDLLLHGITHKNDHPRRRERVSTKLVIRRSTGGVPAERPPPQTLKRKLVSV